MLRFAMLLAALMLAATAVWAEPGQNLLFELNVAGFPGVPRGVKGHVFVPVPLSPPPAPAPPPPPAGDVLRGPTTGDVLRGPPGNVLRGGSSPKEAGSPP